MDPSTKGEQAPPVSIYALDQNSIELGDILLTSAPDSLTGKIIRAATGSPFNHAALYVRYGLFVEAVGPGVCRLAIMATGARAKENIRLLRLSDERVRSAAKMAAAAAGCGEAYLTRGYSVAGAAGVKIAALRDTKRSAMFCSQLVAQSYEEAGLKLLPGKAPETIAPGDLLKSPLLRDATSSALVLIETDEAPTYYLDDASLIERPHHREIITKLEVLHSKPVVRALALLKETPRSFFELERVLAERKDPGLDAAILRGLTKRGFSEEYLRGVRKYANLKQVENATRLSLERIERGTMDDAELRYIISHGATMHKQLEEDVGDRRREYEVYRRGYEQHGLETFGYLAALQKKLLAQSIEYLNAKTRELNALIPEAQSRGIAPGPPA
jgi:uncharacterized protein YycO